jgi:hypothetical protein
LIIALLLLISDAARRPAMTGPISSGRSPQRGLARIKALGSKPAKNQDPHRTVEVKKP